MEFPICLINKDIAKNVPEDREHNTLDIMSKVVKDNFGILKSMVIILIYSRGFSDIWELKYM